MKSGGEAALAANEIRPALEDLRGQTGGHTSWLTGEGTSHIKPSGRVAAGYHLDRADGLRPRLLCSVQCIFGGGCARLDLRHVEVARKALLFAHVGEFRIILVDTECLLSVSFLLRGLDGGEVCTRYRSGERLAGKFVVGFQRDASTRAAAALRSGFRSTASATSALSSGSPKLRIQFGTTAPLRCGPAQVSGIFARADSGMMSAPKGGFFRAQPASTRLPPVTISIVQRRASIV